jgi:hypothetical protein
MRYFISEAAAIGKINAALAEAGSKAKAKYFKDDQSGNSVIRSVVFRAAVPVGDENIVNAIADLGARGDIDRGITYRGGQAEPTDGGEVRYLYFEAKINPFEED